MNFDLLFQMQIILRTIDICLIFCCAIFVIVKFQFCFIAICYVQATSSSLMEEKLWALYICAENALAQEAKL